MAQVDYVQLTGLPFRIEINNANGSWRLIEDGAETAAWFLSTAKHHLYREERQPGERGVACVLVGAASGPSLKPEIRLADGRQPRVRTFRHIWFAEWRAAEPVAPTMIFRDGTQRTFPLRGTHY